MYKAISAIGRYRQNLEPMSGIEPESPAYRAGALPLSYTGMEPPRIIEILPTRYELVVLAASTTEALQNMERDIGLEPMYAGWRPAVLATGRIPQNLDARARFELASFDPKSKVTTVRRPSIT